MATDDWHRLDDLAVQVIDRQKESLAHAEEAVLAFQSGDYPAAAEWLRKAFEEADRAQAALMTMGMIVERREVTNG